MHPTDRKIIESRLIEHGALLQRVINGAGYPYSCIVKDGMECGSAPTEDEIGLIKWWKKAGTKW